MFGKKDKTPAPGLSPQAAHDIICDALTSLKEGGHNYVALVVIDRNGDEAMGVSSVKGESDKLLRMLGPMLETVFSDKEAGELWLDTLEAVASRVENTQLNDFMSAIRDAVKSEKKETDKSAPGDRTDKLTAKQASDKLADLCEHMLESDLTFTVNGVIKDKHGHHSNGVANGRNQDIRDMLATSFIHIFEEDNSDDYKDIWMGAMRKVAEHNLFGRLKKAVEKRA